jgi:alpha-L-fucosidase
MTGNYVALIAMALALAASTGFAGEKAASKLARPTPEQVEYQDMELQMFVCIDPCTWQDRDYDDHSTPLSEINPEKLDTDQWCEVAKSWGAGQILFVAKHTGGFCWWQTETSDYSIRNTPWRGGKGDVLADLSKSCRKYGLKLAIYVYPGDDTWGAYMGGGGKTTDPAKQEGYNEVFRRQLTEVWTKYGPVSELWFDGSCVIEIEDLIQEHAPKAMILQSPHATLRWVGNEAGYAPYPAWNTVKSEDGLTGVSTAAHGDPDGDMWMPLEVDTVNVHPHWWFWKSSGRTLQTTDELMQIYYNSVGRGALLLLNSTPDTSGLIPEEDVAQYAAFGAEIDRRFGQSIAETKGKGETVELRLGGPMEINHVITMEDTRKGERIREYVLEGRSGGAWQTLAAGTSVGHKRIDVFPSVTVDRVRIRATQSAAKPIIRRLAAFNVTGMFPTAIAERSWPLDEGAGDSVADSSGEMTGEIVGATWVEGRRGSALDFDGNSGYVSLGNRDIYGSDLTVAAWIRPRSTAAEIPTIVSKERNGTATNMFRLYLAGGNRLGFWISDNQGHGIWPFVSEADSIPLNEWSHVAATRKGTEFAIYINGQPVASTSSEVVISHANSLDLRIGGRYPPGGDGPDHVFDGAIEDVRFYTRALSADELADPDALPTPGTHWKVVESYDWGRIDESRVYDIDLTEHIRVAGTYEVRFQPTDASPELRIGSVVLVLEGQETPGFAEALDEGTRFLVSRTAAPTGGRDRTILRVKLARGQADGCEGEILIRPAR